MRIISSLFTVVTGVFATALSAASATTVKFTLADLGSDKYRYDYTLFNDSLSEDVALFDILFDPALYAEPSLTPVSSAAITAAWSETILASAPGVEIAYDALATGAGIMPGASLSGFAVEFNWLGTGAPGVQRFEIYDPITFVLLDQGITTALSPGPGPGPTPVTAPETLWLVMLGVCAMAAGCRRRKPRRRTVLQALA